MTLVLNEIKKEKKISPPRIIIYGTPKIGKSTFASCIPNNLLLDIEGGSGALSVSRVGKELLQDYTAFMNVLDDVLTQEHPFKVITIDTVDWLETLVFNHAAKIHGKVNMSEVGYGAGYATAQTLWGNILSKLDVLRKDRGIMIIMLAHEQIRRYDSPVLGSFDKFSLKLQDKDKGSSSVSIIKEWCDSIIFVDQQTFINKETVGFNKDLKRGVTSGERIMHTKDNPAYLAGTRYEGMADEIPFSWENFSAELAKCLTNK